MCIEHSLRLTLVLTSFSTGGSTWIQRRSLFAWAISYSSWKWAGRICSAALWTILSSLHRGFAAWPRNSTDSRLHRIIQWAVFAFSRFVLFSEQWSKGLCFVFERRYVLNSTLEWIEIGRDSSDPLGKSTERLAFLSDPSRFIHNQVNLLTDTFVEIINFKSS